jgi:hypothetical protein
VPGHNLTLLHEHRLELEHGIRQEAELRRKQKKAGGLVQSSQEWGQPRPWLYSLLRRFSQTSFKLVRWLWCHWKINTSLPTAFAQLRLVHAKL